MSQKTTPISSGYLAGYVAQSANAVAIGNNAGSFSQGAGSVAIGYQAGQHLQGVNSMAIGYQAGVTGQGSASFAMGYQAGLDSQGNNALAIGYQAGQTGQGAMAESIGYGAGQFAQGTSAIAIGYMAGNTGQGQQAQAIGHQAGASLQGTGAFAVGFQAGMSSQGAGALALGYMAGTTGQNANTTAVGYMAGAYGQNANAVALGYMAGTTGQGAGAYAIGTQAGNWNQGQNAIAMGFQAGMTGQGANAVAVGYQAGMTGQGQNAVAIGYQAGATGQSAGALAVGFQAGEFSQGLNSIAMGTNAGMTGQGANSLAVGANAGAVTQGLGAIAFGASAGQFSQGDNALAMGHQAGMTGQKANAVAIGFQAGQSMQGDNAFAMGNQAGMIGQGQNAVAIGNQAGQMNQGNNSLAIGYQAGINQGSSTVAVGYQAGMTGQGFGAFAMGYQAGNFGQGVNAMAVGFQAGMTGQKSGALAVGYGAGLITQGSNAMAVGYGAGMYNQGDNGFAVGYQAGVTGQGANTLAMGYQAGAVSQGAGAIAIGYQAGATGQGTNAVAVGYQAGMTGQGANASAIGYQAGQFYQGQNSVAMGFQAGMTGQGQNSVAIGNYAGNVRQTSNAFALGSQAGQTNQGSGAMGLGVLAGNTNQGENAFAAGVGSGHINQGTRAMAIGVEAGKFSQGIDAFAAGLHAGMTGQGASAAAIGYQAGAFLQGTGAFALGYQAGQSTQGLNAVALGYQAGQSTQGNFAVAVGNLAGATGQNTNAVAIGNFAGQFGQGAGSVAIGFQAGMTGQKANTVAIGNSAGQFNQGANALAIGFQAGMTGQNDNAMALGNSAGQFAQGTGAFAIGFQAGRFTQGTGAFAIGFQAGQFTQGSNSFALGSQAGVTGQRANAFAAGFQAGELNQGTGAFAVGFQAGELNQGTGAFAAGFQAGQFTQGANALALGFQAGITGQGTNSVAMGFQAGETNQGANAFAVGYQAGELRQGTGAFAAGFQAGQFTQGAGAVALGFQAGYTGQGANSIAIGNQAGVTGITPNSIVLNASGAGFFATGPTGAFYVSPISTVADSGMIKGNILVYGDNNQIMKTPATIDKDGGFFYTNPTSLGTNQAQVSTLVVLDGRVQTPLTSFAAGNNAGTTGMYNISGKSTSISEDGKYVLSIISNFLCLSSDSGTTFVSKNIESPDSIAMSSSGQYMLVSTLSPYNIYRSDDFGNNWIPIMSRMTSLFNTTKNNAIWNSPSVVGITTGGMVITSNLTSFYSSDNGTTWEISKQMVSHYFPFNGDILNIGNSSSPITFSNPNTGVTFNNSDYYIGNKSAYFGNANSGTPTSYLSTSWDLVSNTTFTISCRFLLSNGFTPGPQGATIWCSGNAGAKNFYLVINSDKNLFFGSNNSSMTNNLGQVKRITNGVWYYVVVTLKSNLFNMYVDGELISSVYLNQPFTSNNTFFTLGSTPDRYVNTGFNGCIDDFRIYEGVDIGLELMQNLSTTTRLLNSITPTYPIQMYNPSIYPSLLVLLNADDATIGISNFQQSGSSIISSTSPYSGSKSYLFNSGTYSGQLTLPLSFTISCVLRFSIIPSLSVPFSLINSTDPSKIIELFMNVDGAFCVATGSSPASSSIITTGCKPPINTWYYIAITVSSTGVNFYINGNPNGSYTTTNLLTSGIYGNTVNLVLGALNTSGSNPFSGNIDDFRIYGGVMSSYQINTIYTDMTKITPVYYASFENNTDGTTLLNNLPVVSGAGIYNFSTANKITGNNSLLMKLSGSSDSLGGTNIKSSVDFYGFSVSFWIRFETLRVVGSDYSLPFLLADTNNASPNLSLHQSKDGRLHGRLWNGGPDPVLTPISIPVDINIWYHITIVQDYQHAFFYVNGISIGSIFTGVINWKWMYLGFNGIYSQFNGWFDEFKLYQTSLNQHQVTALYTSYSTSPALTGSSVTLPFPRSLKNTSYTVSGSTQLTTTLDKVYTTTGTTDTELKNIYNAFNPVIVGNRGAFCTEKIIYSYINSFSSEQPAINVLNSTDTFASISLASDGTIYAGSTSGMLKNSSKISDISLFVTRNNAIAIGNQAGQYAQGFNTIAIGNKAGQTFQPSNTIILNASGSALNAEIANGCYISPIADHTNSTSKTFNLLGYGSDNQIVKLATYLTPTLTNYVSGGISIVASTAMLQSTKAPLIIQTMQRSGKPLSDSPTDGINTVTAGFAIGVEDNITTSNSSTRLDVMLSSLANAGNNWGSTPDKLVATFTAQTGLEIKNGCLRVTSNSGGTNENKLGITAVGTGYYFSGGISPATGSTTGHYGKISIYAAGDIIGGAAIGVFSDARIKKDITDAVGSIDIINKIPLHQYNYIDPERGTHTAFGVIAQEVKAAFPEAIKLVTEYIPNIFCIATSIISVDETVQITIASEHGLVVGDKVKIILEKGDRNECKVVSIIDANTVAVEKWDNYDESEKVFLYGKEVNDFHSVDKTRLATLALGGIQDLYKMIKDLQTQVATLQAQISAQNSSSTGPTSPTGSTGPTGSTDQTGSTGSTGPSGL